MRRSLHELSWPAARLGEAIETAGRRAGFGPHEAEVGAPPARLLTGDSAALGRWIEAAAAWLGLEAEPVEWLEMIEELSRINASVGWNAFIQSGIGLTFLDPETFERAGFGTLNEGQKISYELDTDQRRGKQSAVNLKTAR